MEGKIIRQFRIDHTINKGKKVLRTWRDIIRKEHYYNRAIEIWRGIQWERTVKKVFKSLIHNLSINMRKKQAIITLINQ